MEEVHSDIEKLAKIKIKLQKLYPVRRLSRKLVKNVKVFEHFVFVRHKHEECKLADITSEKDLAFFRKFFCEYETLLEKNKALELINHRCSAKHCLYKDRVLSRTFTYAEMEGKMANVTEKDKVLFIGSGPFPETAIGYAMKFNCNVVCLDKNKLFVDISRKVIQKLGLSEKISVVHGTPDKIDVSGFDKILVAALAVPKGDIIKELEKSDADIILRTSFGSSKLVYIPVENALLTKFRIKKKFIRWGKNFTSSILIKKKRL